MMNWISEVWCKKMHSQAMWPIHGKYICPQCLREYRVAWEGPASPAEYADPSLRNAGLAIASQNLAHSMAQGPVSTTL
jgi:hypothetical protein